MSNEFAHDVALEWAKAHADDRVSPVEFGLQAAQVYLAANVAFFDLVSDASKLTARLAVLSAPSEMLQALGRLSPHCPATEAASSQARSPDAEGSA